MEITIEDGVDGGVIEDARFINNQVDKNYGVFTSLTISGSTKNSAIKVLLTDYSGVTVLQSRFILDCLDISGAPILAWYEILRDWTQGIGNGDPANDGEITWNSARHNVQAWTTAGCEGIGDKNMVAEGSKEIEVGENLFLPISNTLCQKWLDNDNDNNGIVLNDLGASTTNFASTERGVDVKPFFYMEYTDDFTGFAYMVDVAGSSPDFSDTAMTTPKLSSVTMV